MFCYFMMKFLICHHQSIDFLSHSGSGELLNGDSLLYWKVKLHMHRNGNVSYFPGRLMYICMEMDFKENEAVCGLFFRGCVSQ